ncbi:hypothetical protein EVAR_95086_1 [Eumeta japonica]|uniref:Uncharacterized protein n=1 Tax=Eumeta variegata TaxID=151549 RepID=A0A4C1W915_EUMVA|nr:hypothetical protein EVAR_95086_1 [Eumeta japonica]
MKIGLGSFHLPTGIVKEKKFEAKCNHALETSADSVWRQARHPRRTSYHARYDVRRGVQRGVRGRRRKFNCSATKEIYSLDETHCLCETRRLRWPSRAPPAPAPRRPARD